MKVVVIGAGIVGVSAALELADAGAQVVIVDDGRPGRATAAGAGIVAAPWRRRGPGDPGFDLANRAFETYPALIDRLAAEGEPAGLFEVIGHLHTAPPGPQLDGVYDLLSARLDAGDTHVGAVTRLTEAEAAAAFPYLRPDLAAVHVETTARVDGEMLRSALGRAAARGGARFRAGPGALELAGGRLAGVTVGGQVEPADAVVVAAGAWSADLLRPTRFKLAVSPQRGQIAHLHLPGDDTARLPCVQPVGADHYLLPFADSRVVAGATRETGAGFDPRLTAAGVAHVLDNALGVAPGLAEATVGELRVGLRPASADGNPLLGPVPDWPGLYVATGMGAEGLTLGPFGGAALARLVLGADPGIDLAPFSLDRSFD